mmetsp:Transcript_10812/g.13590  ORF Transcript_10812/g.13590 Transcript_10812/m.13590 type:complete len:100 (-) Transcript_10812:3739-4038(-)
MGEMYIKTLAEFEGLKAGDKPLIVDFTASWCPPCKRIAPIYERLAGENPDIVFKKVDVDEASEVAQANGIACMPTFKLFKGGAEVESAKIEGASEEKIN